jgi:hypothetical protein
VAPHGQQRDGALVWGGDAAGVAPVYYIGIIDLLQTWTLTKRVERLLKLTLCCRCGPSAMGMSAVEPKAYATRFLRMVEKIVDVRPPPAEAA